MKTIFTTILFCSFSLISFAQEDVIQRVNTIDHPTGVTPNGFMFPQYQDGKVTLNNNSVIPAKLNYNFVNNQIFFINPEGVALILAHPENTVNVTIGKDTFYFLQKGFIQKITHADVAPNLFMKKNMKYIGKEKEGAYGSFSDLSAVNSNSTYSPDEQHNEYINTNENIIFKTKFEYFISDSKGNLFPAQKGGFYGAFPKHISQLKEYFKTHKLDFNKSKDLVQIISFIQNLPPTE